MENRARKNLSGRFEIFITDAQAGAEVVLKKTKKVQSLSGTLIYGRGFLEAADEFGFG